MFVGYLWSEGGSELASARTSSNTFWTGAASRRQAAIKRCHLGGRRRLLTWGRTFGAGSSRQAVQHRHRQGVHGNEKSAGRLEIALLPGGIRCRAIAGGG